MTDSKKQETKKRPQRVPVARRRVLTAQDRKGFVRRWVNDIDDRIAMFEEAGYVKVRGEQQDISDPNSAKPSKLGSEIRKSVGSGIYAVLMEIPEEFYTEDQEAKQRQIDEIEESYDNTGHIVGKTYGTVKKTRGSE